MGESDFNPYHKWLGIPPAEQPPNYYRLLGIELHESDPDVIESAADQRMSHLRTFQGGKNAQLSQKLLNEVSAARICLLKEETRIAYDKSLAQKESTNDSPAPPPIRVSDRRPPIKKSPVGLIAIVAVLIVIVGGSVFAISQLGKKDNREDAVQTASNGDDAKKKNGNESNRLIVPKKDTVENDRREQNEQNGGATSSKKGQATNDVAEKDDSNSTGPEKNGTDTDNADGKPGGDDSKMPNGKNPPDLSPGKAKTDSTYKDPDVGKSEPKKDETKNPSTEDDPVKSDPPESVPPKGDPEMKGDSTKVVRVSLPASDRWQPLIPALKTEYAVKSDLKNEARFSIFHKLLDDAVKEPDAGKACALFNLALEQAKILNLASGIDKYCKSFCARFEYDELKAKMVFLKSIGGVIKSKLRLAQFLIEANKVIRQDKLEAGKTQPAGVLLQTIVTLADEPVGSNIDKSFYENWLTAHQLLSKTSKDVDILKEKERNGTLTPEEHRQLGNFYLFVAKLDKLGIEHLTKCGYKPIVDVAKKEASGEFVDVKSIENIADEWWVLAGKCKEEQHLFRLRSKHWYDVFQSRALTSEISKKSQQRIATLSSQIGLKRLSNVRAPSNVIALNNKKKFSLADLKGNAVHIQMPTPATLGIWSDDYSDRVGGRSHFRLIRTDNQNQIYSKDGRDGIVPSPPMVFSGKFAWMTYGSAYAYDLTSEGEQLIQSPIAYTSFTYKAPEKLVGYAIGEKGDVFGIGKTHLHWWNPQTAWKKKRDRFRVLDNDPVSIKMAIPFEPKQVRVVPKSSIAVLSDSQNLSTFNPLNNTVKELHSQSELLDYDFASDGGALLTALKGGVKYKTFKTNKNLFFQTSEPVMVRFFPNPRFFVSLHKDHSLRIWNMMSKESNFLADRIDLPDFNPTLFAIAPDGSAIALADKDSNFVVLDLIFE